MSNNRVEIGRSNEGRFKALFKRLTLIRWNILKSKGQGTLQNTFTVKIRF